MSDCRDSRSLTPGVSTARSLNLRPFSGRLTVRFVSTVVPNVAFSVCSTGCPALTSTVCCVEPSDIGNVEMHLLRQRKLNSGCVIACANPLRIHRHRSRFPAPGYCTRYCPSPEVFTVFSWPVASARTRTVAPGITEPCGSVTDPRIEVSTVWLSQGARSKKENENERTDKQLAHKASKSETGRSVREIHEGVPPGAALSCRSYSWGRNEFLQRR